MILSVCAGMPSEIANIISKVINIIKIVVPVGLVIFGMIDFARATWAQKDEEIAKGRNTFFKRLISGALVFFVIAIVQLLFNLLDTNGSDESISCLNAILNGSGGTSYGGSVGGSDDKTTASNETKECTGTYYNYYKSCIESSNAGHISIETCNKNYPSCANKYQDKTTTITTTTTSYKKPNMNNTAIVGEKVVEFVTSIGLDAWEIRTNTLKGCGEDFAEGWDSEIGDWNPFGLDIAAVKCLARIWKADKIDIPVENAKDFVTMLNGIKSDMDIKKDYKYCSAAGYYTQSSIRDKKLMCLRNTYCQFENATCYNDVETKLINNKINNLNQEICVKEEPADINSGEWYRNDDTDQYCKVNYLINVNAQDAIEYCNYQVAACMATAGVEYSK